MPSVTAAFYLQQLPLALSAVALVILARRDARPPLTWLWLPALLLAEMAAGREAFLTTGRPSLLRQVRAENAIILVLMLALAAGLARLLRRRTRRRSEAAS